MVVLVQRITSHHLFFKEWFVSLYICSPRRPHRPLDCTVYESGREKAVLLHPPDCLRLLLGLLLGFSVLPAVWQAGNFNGIRTAHQKHLYALQVHALLWGAYIREGKGTHWGGRRQGVGKLQLLMVSAFQPPIVVTHVQDAT